ncbi:hypothetical protein QN379_20990 [Glaciimonas sp. Gout2]|uniref:hypothetical protein n=1 Tax=unclassified Glaciimonas TaxID=2644401 RepID=UPI002B23775F|nr:MULTISPECIES: hypothetical protein [unclassified Glaciimonas]MEB0014272.1 hypothetical protein [Glaciimonas sp. Cout2]MEB0084490.1 hypothetical protein [Glaciimonas sp. Gout2]
MMPYTRCVPDKNGTEFSSSTVVVRTHHAKWCVFFIVARLWAAVAGRLRPAGNRFYAGLLTLPFVAHPISNRDAA